MNLNVVIILSLASLAVTSAFETDLSAVTEGPTDSPFFITHWASEEPDEGTEESTQLNGISTAAADENTTARPWLTTISPEPTTMMSYEPTTIMSYEPTTIMSYEPTTTTPTEESDDVIMNEAQDDRPGATSAGWQDGSKTEAEQSNLVMAGGIAAVVMVGCAAFFAYQASRHNHPREFRPRSSPREHTRGSPAATTLGYQRFNNDPDV